MRNVLKKGRSAPQWTRYAVAGLFAAVLAGCGGGSDGAPGANGKDGTNADPTVTNNLQAQITALTQATNPETCVACHTGATPVASSGSGHQAEYDKAKTNSMVVTIEDPVTIVGTKSELTLSVTRAGVPLTAADIIASTMSQKRVYAVHYNGDKVDKTFSYATSGTASATNVLPVDVVGNKIKFTAINKAGTATSGANLVSFDPAASDAQIYIVLADTKLATEGSLYDNVVNAGKAYGALVTTPATYTSAANESACVTCHGAIGGDTTGAGGKFLKAGYRAAKVSGLQDFQACRSCHVDDPTVIDNGTAATNSKGGHYEWQLEKDNPARLAEIKALVATAIAAGDTAHDSIAENMTADELAKYKYVKSVMNDVHMAHAMEFPYPQSMQNCATCHAGKESVIFAASKFTAETCISCHSVEGIKAKMTASAFAHATQVASDTALRASTCSNCHNGADAPTSAAIHKNGYNPKIYASDGTRYANAITASIGAVTFDSATNKLNIKVTATGAVGTVAASNIVPTVLVGLYGYDTKDFLVPAHGTNATDKTRNLEYVWDGTATNNPKTRFTQVGKTTAAGVTTWELTADLSLWADKIAAGAVKRAEIAAMPTLKHPTLVDPASTTTPKAMLTLALNAPSKTFNLVTKAFVTSPAIVPAGATTCNSCHDALATTFHSGDRGGNLVVCRICHESSSPGAHLEMQSRSIDSYVHAIHSFQAFDISGIDLNNPVAAMEYKSHVASGYPNGSIKNCQSCHAASTFDVPNQSKSMPGVASKASAFKAGTRNIGTVPQIVTGPAERACGSCHVSQAINANTGLGDSTKLAILNSHFKQNGYQVDASAYSSTTTPTLFDLWTSITGKLMAMFK